MLDLQTLTRPEISTETLEQGFFQKAGRPVVVALPRNDPQLFQGVRRQSVTVPQSDDPRWIDGVRRAVYREIETVTRFIKSGRHFGVENVSETGPEALARLRGVAKHMEMAQKGYPQRLFPSFLSWTRADNLPVFMVMAWDSRDFSIRVIPGFAGDRVECDFETHPYLHPLLAMQYLPAVQHLAKDARREGQEITIAARYAGSIPLATKLKMERAARSGLFEEFYIAAEAPKWQVRKIVRAQTDPIVFGRVKVEGDSQFHIIDIFDPTPIEAAAAEQYMLEPPRKF